MVIDIKSYITAEKGDGLMTNMEAVNEFIHENRKLYCDDCLSDELDIKPRQQINQICRNLMKDGVLNREKRQCAGCSKEKLVNVSL